ncbi:hypothetical protein F511_39244 [Dorcoceras hygrometricum]|uniref:Uncharacterized protein n=1 Tax=Dorcoceras hygrometricum TaxID=472368 RepID=A0A2Z7CL39_9LAMI|nr:hypothetical protein F511_39244 [Dorcoceras hygrometricum]
MASSLFSNTNEVHFASVLAMDNAGMVAMFEALVASGLNGFLGCIFDIFEISLVEFYQNASVRDGKFISTVQGKSVEISEDVFARTFQLPVDGLTDMNEVPKDLVFVARTEFSFTGEQLETSCKKRELKIEFGLLSDILEKSVTVKAGSFDAVTHERFLMMTAINRGVKINWSRLLFNIFTEMVTPRSRQARGYANYWQVYSINDKISVEDVEDVGDVSRVKKTPVKRATSKKRPAVAVDEQAIPLQIVAPIPAVSAVPPPKTKRKAPKRKLKLTPASDDETITKDADVWAIEKQGEGTSADVLLEEQVLVKQFLVNRWHRGLMILITDTRSVLGKWVYLVTLAMSLFDLQDVCIAIGSLATLDLPMVVDQIGIYGLKGPYCTLTTTSWFLQALSVIPRRSWGDVARRSYHDPMGNSGIVIPEQQWLWAHG